MNKFIVMWCSEGLECMFDITDMDHDAMISGLKNEPIKTPFNISMMMLRARYNDQRSYEIYTFEVQDSISCEEMKDLFNDSPQYFAELIREKGHKIYSDYSKKAKAIS